MNTMHCMLVPVHWIQYVFAFVALTNANEYIVFDFVLYDSSLPDLSV